MPLRRVFSADAKPKALNFKDQARRYSAAELFYVVYSPGAPSLRWLDAKSKRGVVRGGSLFFVPAERAHSE